MSVTHQPMLKQHKNEQAPLVTADPVSVVYQKTIVESVQAARTEELWEERERFDEQLMTREKLLSHALPGETTPEHTAPVMKPPVAPELSDKDQKKKAREAEKNLKKGKKLTPAASEYTVPVLESEKQRKKKDLPDHTDIPETELYAHVEKMQINAYEFTPEYMGEHFQETRAKIRDLRRLLDHCGSPGTDGYDALTQDQKYRMEYLLHVYHALAAAYSDALAANGLTEDADGSVTASPASDAVAARQRSTGSVERLKGILLEDKEKQTQFMRRDADDLFRAEDLTEDQKQVQDAHRERSLDLITCRSERSYADFETAIEIMSHLTSEKNDLKMAAGGVLKPPKLKELTPKYHLALARQVFQDLRSTIEDADLLAARYAGGMKKIDALDQTSRFAAVAREQAEEFRSRYDILARRKDMLMAGLRHLADGDALPEDAALLLEEKYGYTDPKMVEKRGDYAKKTRRYNEITNARRTAHAKAVKDTFPDEDPDQYLLGDIQRMEMLMKTGGTQEDQDYNGAIMILAKEINMLHALSAKQAQLETRKQSLDEKDQNDLDQLLDTVGQDTMTVLEPIYAQIMQFDTRTIQHASDEELAAMQEQLIELNLAGMMATDLGQHQVSSADKTMVRDRLLGKPAPLREGATEEEKKAYEEALSVFARNNAIFGAKCSMIQAAMMKARAAVILKANMLGDLKKEDIMTPSEVGKNEGQIAVGGTEGEFCTAFARKQYERGVALEKSAVRRMMNDPKLQGYVIAHPMEFGQPALQGAVGRLEGHMEEVSVRSQKLGKGNITAIGILIEEKTEMIASFNEALTEGKLPAEAAVELRTRIAELEEDIRFMKIQSVIQDRPLRLVGQKKNFIREALFRAYGGFQQTDAARSMSDDQYIRMLEQISAEAFLPEDPSAEQVETAKQTQLAGLKTYYEALQVNYDHMEALFGVEKTPDITYLLEHRSQIEQLGADTQVMCGMVANGFAAPETKSLVSERMWHQAEYFNMLVGAGSLFLGRIQDARLTKQPVDTEAYQQDINRILSVAEEHRQYLVDHPRADG